MPRRLLAVLAHPDDESLGLGGTLAKYAAGGVTTFLVTATLGESGRYRGRRQDDPEHPGPEALARTRERELRAAAAVLGVREVSLLGYRDQHLDRVDPREAIARIAAHVRRVRPHVMITFGPDGVYGHPDHIAISQFTTAAVVAAADRSFAGDTDGQHAPPHAVSKLYYLVWAESNGSVLREVFGALASKVDGGERQPVLWPDWSVSTMIDAREYWPVAWKAVSCHQSQVTANQRLASLSREQHEILWGRQPFYRAFSTVNGGRQRETDLFEGLEV